MGSNQVTGRANWCHHAKRSDSLFLKNVSITKPRCSPDQPMASSENGKTAANQQDHSHHCVPSTARAVTPPKVGFISVNPVLYRHHSSKISGSLQWTGSCKDVSTYIISADTSLQLLVHCKLPGILLLWSLYNSFHLYIDFQCTTVTHSQIQSWITVHTFFTVSRISNWDNYPSHWCTIAASCSKSQNEKQLAINGVPFINLLAPELFF